MIIVNRIKNTERAVQCLLMAMVAVFGLISLPAWAQRDDEWVLLGEQRVQFPGDRDVIRLSRRDGRFSAIALRARGSDIRIFSVRVTYANGEREELTYGETLRDGDRTRPLDLRGSGRALQEIELRYGAPPTALLRQPEVQIFGRLADERRGGGDRDRDGGRDSAGGGGRDNDEEFFNREGKRASCDTYAKIAVIQSEAADKYRCRLRGPEWNANEREHFRWCLRAPRQRLLADVRSRYEALGKCFEALGDQDYDIYRGGGRSR